jgi:hypothetical protein
MVRSRVVALIAFASLGAVAAVGCRAVIGIDDLTLDDGGGADAARDGGGQSDGAPPQDANVMDVAMDAAASTCGTTSSSRGMCGGCCSMQFQNGLTAWVNIAHAGGASSCPCTTCTPMGCTTQQAVCGGTMALQPMTQCTGCVSSSAIGSACPNESTTCRNDVVNCKPWLDCMQTCEPLPP